MFVLCTSHRLSGALGGSRTPDRLVRSQVLYPAELPARGAYYLYAAHTGQLESSKIPSALFRVI